ncbi:hypothetical protein MMC31_007753, partial [Peltigera leucophlebia]|nr:hypothetical protein [Peltigera leucophlebia]
MVVRKRLAKMVQDVENKSLGLFKTIELQASAIEKVRGEIIANIARKKQEWLDKRAADRAVGIITSYKKQPDWKKKQQDQIKTAAGQERDVIRENALIVLNLGLLYLDFIDACRGGFSARVEKCIQCFAVVFQGSAAKNYARETMHMVACLKKIWKPEL